MVVGSAPALPHMTCQHFTPTAAAEKGKKETGATCAYVHEGLGTEQKCQGRPPSLPSSGLKKNQGWSQQIGFYEEPGPGLDGQMFYAASQVTQWRAGLQLTQ